MVRLISFSLFGPVVLSAIGPIYFGYTHAPFSRAIIWALLCMLWWAWPSLKSALTDAEWLQPLWYKTIAVAAVIAIFAAAFVGGDSLAYLLARSISN